MLNTGKPLFVPEFDSEFRLYPSIVIKLSRLGKAISPRFAHRYVDSAAIGLNARACNVEASCRAGSLPWSDCAAFDGSVITGNFFDIDISAPPAFEIAVNGQTATIWNPEHMTRTIAEIIHHLSLRHTMKIGDLIFAALSPEGIPIKINDHVTGTIDGKKLLAFNIK